MSNPDDGRSRREPAEAWPPLPLDEWRDTYATLHLMTQVVGKIRLACAPMTNHWWQATLYVTPRGLTTASVPHGTRTYQIDFDLIDHVLVIRTSNGDERKIALQSRPIAEFYRQVMEAMRELAVPVRIWTRPVEIEHAIPFDEDFEHATYVPEHAHRFWQALRQAHRLTAEFRSGFVGKSSPAHFFWGSFDLAVTRFSGRLAPPHPGGIPNLADWVAREAYSHECSSCGFWPGSGAVQEAAFYAYTYPEPPGYAEFPVRPAEAYYNDTMREYILPYEAVRRARDPDAMVLEFFRSTYEAGAERGGWDRAMLEYENPVPDAGSRPGRAPALSRHEQQR